MPNFQRRLVSCRLQLQFIAGIWDAHKVGHLLLRFVYSSLASCSVLP